MTESTTPTPSDPALWQRRRPGQDRGPQTGRARKRSGRRGRLRRSARGPPVKPPSRPTSATRPKVDFKYLREQVTMEQVLQHLGLPTNLRGRGRPRRGPCPVHSHPGAAERTFSVHLGKNVFQCFHAECAVKGNVLDLWAAIHRLSLYDAALHLAETFALPRNREEEPVTRTRPAPVMATSTPKTALPPVDGNH